MSEHPPPPRGECPVIWFARTRAAVVQAAARGDRETVRRLLIRDHGMPPAEAERLAATLRGLTPDAAREAAARFFT